MNSPVSYTHLDVYKRQSASVSATFAVTPDAEKYATSFLLMVFYPFNIFVSCCTDAPGRMEERCCIMRSLDSVSYTHLDVYKRQHRDSAIPDRN